MKNQPVPLWLVRPGVVKQHSGEGGAGGNAYDDMAKELGAEN
jgi:hypothetical protein